MKPNIVIIVMDNVKAKRLSCYGYGRNTTPCLDKIASRGVIFKNAFSTSNSSPPAHASLFSGFFPWEHKIRKSKPYFHKEIKSIAEILQDIGYETMGLSSSIDICRKTNFHKGFDQFCEIWNPASFFPKSNPIPFKFKNRFRRFIGKNDKGAENLNNMLKRIIPTLSGKPFFLFINYTEVHSPYIPPKRYSRLYVSKEKKIDARKINSIFDKALLYSLGLLKLSFEEIDILNSLYDACLNYLDDKIGEVYKLFARNNLLDNTLFIISSDHGENIFEHGLLTRKVPSLFDDSVHIPFIVSYPKLILPDRKVDSIIQITDIFPTISNLLNIKMPKSFLRTHQGIDLLRLLDNGDKNLDRAYAFAESKFNNKLLAGFEDSVCQINSATYDKHLYMIRTDSYKYIKSFFKGKEQVLLFNLRKDPNEIYNVVSEEKDMARFLESKIKATIDFHKESL